MEIEIMKFTSEDNNMFGHLFSRMRSYGWGFWAVLVVAGSFVAAGVITACSGGKSNQAGAVSYESAPCPQPNLPGFPEADLGPNYSCGYLTVPENRRKPDGPTIRIAVARARYLDFDCPAKAGPGVGFIVAHAGPPSLNLLHRYDREGRAGRQGGKMRPSNDPETSSGHGSG